MLWRVGFSTKAAATFYSRLIIGPRRTKKCKGLSQVAAVKRETAFWGIAKIACSIAGLAEVCRAQKAPIRSNDVNHNFNGNIRLNFFYENVGSLLWGGHFTPVRYREMASSV